MKDSKPDWMTLPAKPRKLTVNDLQYEGACFPQVAEFIHCFDEWILVTSTTAIGVAERFAWEWGLRNLLSPLMEIEARKLYRKRQDRFKEECLRIYRSHPLETDEYKKAIDYLEYAYQVDLACLFTHAYNADTWRNRVRIRFHDFFHRLFHGG